MFVLFLYLNVVIEGKFLFLQVICSRLVIMRAEKSDSTVVI